MPVVVDVSVAVKFYGVLVVSTEVVDVPPSSEVVSVVFDGISVVVCVVSVVVVVVSVSVPNTTVILDGIK